MPKPDTPITFGELDFNLVASMEQARAVLDADSPFRMLLMGDFSGSSNRGVNPSAKAQAGLKPILVDRDNIEQVMDRLKVAIELPLLGPTAPAVPLDFTDLDDFHPDSLYQRLEVFQALKETRKSLQDPKVLATFMQEMKSSTPSELHEKEIKRQDPLPEQPGAGLLDQIIEQSEPSSPASSSPSVPATTELGSFLQSIVKPNLVEREHPRLEEMLDGVDAAASELMGLVLHHEAFQSLEAAWRSLAFLVSRLETDSKLQLYLLDISKLELAVDLQGTEELQRTALYKLLVEQAVGTAGGQPWSVVAGNYSFSKESDDLELLGRAAKIVHTAGASFLAAADDGFLTVNSLLETPDPDDWPVTAAADVEESWQALRLLPEAESLGLALPRMLLRLPYGAKTDPVDLFNFEEMTGILNHRDYLWGNPCFALLLLLGQSFSREGWQMRPGTVLDIDSLPLHIYKEEEESRVKPCAEVMLSQRAAESILDKGLMPMLSFYNQDRVRLGRFQSIASPTGRLFGPWS